jgi:hypothetical protein
VGWQPQMHRDPMGLKVLRRKSHGTTQFPVVWNHTLRPGEGGWGGAPPPDIPSGSVTVDETVILRGAGTPGEDCQALQRTGMDELDASARCNAFNPQAGTQPAAFAGARGALLAKKPVDVMATATMVAASFYMPGFLADTLVLPAAYLEGSGALGAAHYVPPEPLQPGSNSLEYNVARHGSQPAGRSPYASHHGVQKEYLKRNVPGYDANKDPTILLDNAKGGPHRTITGEQSTFRAQQNASTGSPYGGDYGQWRAEAIAQMRRNGVPEAKIAEWVLEHDGALFEIGIPVGGS